MKLWTTDFIKNTSMLDDVESLDTSFLEGIKRKKERVIKEECKCYEHNQKYYGQRVLFYESYDEIYHFQICFYALLCGGCYLW